LFVETLFTKGLLELNKKVELKDIKELNQLFEAKLLNSLPKDLKDDDSIGIPLSKKNEKIKRKNTQ